jgi:hypothetical protein
MLKKQVLTSLKSLTLLMIEIFFLHNNMWLQVIRVKNLFLEFLKSFDA